MCYPGQYLVVVLEIAHQDSFVHVPAPDDAQSELHICCIELETRHMNMMNNEICNQIKNLAMHIPSCNRGNELVCSQLCLPMLYLTPKVACNPLQSPCSYHRDKHVLC